MHVKLILIYVSCMYVLVLADVREGRKVEAKKGGGETKKKLDVFAVGIREKGGKRDRSGVREGIYKQSSQPMMLTQMILFFLRDR